MCFLDDDQNKAVSVVPYPSHEREECYLVRFVN